MKHFRLPIPQLIILFCYVLITGLLIAYKYSHFLYTQLDLAIFANALRQPWSHLLYSTVQGHHYFGDHFMPYLIVLKPFFDLFNQSTIFLLTLQMVMIASAAWPLKKLLDLAIDKKYHTLFFALFFFNTLAIDIALYEFHPELLYIPLILWLVYFFTAKKYAKYLIALLAILLIREDSLLAILPFTIFSIIEKRNWKWWLPPLFSLLYFYAALKIIGHFNPEGHSTFLRFYSWLGTSIPNIIVNNISHPLLIIRHMATIHVLEFVLGGLMMFLFLPIFSPRYLLIGLFSYASMALGVVQDTGIYHSHYASVIFPSLVCAAIFGLRNVLKKHDQTAEQHKNFVTILLIIILLYFHTTSLSPFSTVISEMNDGAFQAGVVAQREALNHIDLNLPTVASYQYLDRIKSPEVYFIGYALQQLQQFRVAPYHLPQTTVQSALDVTDLFTFGVNVNFDFYKQYERQFADIIRQFPVKYRHDGLIIGSLTGQSYSQPAIELQKISNENEYFKNLKYQLTDNYLNITGIIKTPPEINSPLFAKIETFNEAGKSTGVNYQNFGQGTAISSEWITGNEYEFAIEIPVPENTKTFKISMEKIEGAHVLNPLGTSQLVVDTEKEISSITIK